MGGCFRVELVVCKVPESPHKIDFLPYLEYLPGGCDGQGAFRV